MAVQRVDCGKRRTSNPGAAVRRCVMKVILPGRCSRRALSTRQINMKRSVLNPLEAAKPLLIVKCKTTRLGDRVLRASH